MENEIKQLIQDAKSLYESGKSDKEVAEYVHIELGKLIIYNNNYSLGFEGYNVDEGIEGHKSKASEIRQEEILASKPSIKSKEQVCQGMAEIYTAILNEIGIDARVVAVKSKEEVDGELREDGTVIDVPKIYKTRFDSDFEVEVYESEKSNDGPIGHYYSIVNLEEGEFIQDFLTEKALTRIKIGEADKNENIPGFHKKEEHRERTKARTEAIAEEYVKKIREELHEYMQGKDDSEILSFIFEKLREHIEKFGFEEAKDFAMMYVQSIIPRGFIKDAPIPINLVKEDEKNCEVISIYQYGEKKYMLRGGQTSENIPIGEVTDSQVHDAVSQRFVPRKLEDAKRLKQYVKPSYSKTEIETAIRNGETIAINDEVIDEMRFGKLNPYILREGLCGKDVRKFDFSGLSDDHLRYLSFDTETQFPEELQKKAETLLDDARCIMRELQELHDMGLDGSGRKITIVDTPIEIPEDIEYYGFDNVEKDDHGATVLSIVKSIAPGAKIVFIGDDKRAGKDRKEKLDNFIESNAQIREAIHDSDIISISSPITMDRRFLDDKCEVLNSPRFYSSSEENLGFRYGLIKRTDGEEKIEPADCISEGKSRKSSEKFFLQELGKLGLIYTAITPDNIDEIVDKLKATGMSEEDHGISLLKKVATTDEEFHINSINEDRLITPGTRANPKLVCIPSAGITVRQNDGKYKYMATNSNSFSIPVVSALFAIARQIKSDITLEDFSHICKDTAKEQNGVMIISPMGVIRQIQERQNNISKLAEQALDNMVTEDMILNVDKKEIIERSGLTKEGKTD